MQKFIIHTPDETEIQARKYSPKSESEAIIIIVHGMAEHQKRYAKFAETLTDNHYTAYTYDQRGHGETAGTPENLGFFAYKNGQSKVVGDLDLLVQTARKENPSKPLFLLGHSMGSFVCRNYIQNKSDKIDGIILSGTAASAGLLGKSGIILAAVIAFIMGKKHPSKILDKLSFGDFNKTFKPARTKFDWLSKDETIVDEYIADPFCGTIFSAGFFYDMLNLMENANNAKLNAKIRNTLPIFLISGENDPVGDFGKGVQKVFEHYQKLGVQNIEMKLYPTGRHEMLNEVNKKVVFSDIANQIRQWANS